MMRVLFYGSFSLRFRSSANFVFYGLKESCQETEATVAGSLKSSETKTAAENSAALPLRQPPVEDHHALMSNQTGQAQGTLPPLVESSAFTESTTSKTGTLDPPAVQSGTQHSRDANTVTGSKALEKQYQGNRSRKARRGRSRLQPEDVEQDTNRRQNNSMPRDLRDEVLLVGDGNVPRMEPLFRRHVRNDALKLGGEKTKLHSRPTFDADPRLSETKPPALPRHTCTLAMHPTAAQPVPHGGDAHGRTRHGPSDDWHGATPDGPPVDITTAVKCARMATRDVVAGTSVTDSGQTHRHTVADGTKRSWWDGEVQAAVEARRIANRQHRRTAKLSDDTACQAAWENHLQAKHKMQTMTQRKIAEAECKTLLALWKEGKGTGAKFGAYVYSLDSRPTEPTLRDPVTDRKADDLRRLLSGNLEQLYGTPLTLQAASGTPIPSSSAKTVPDDVHWKVSGLAVDKAIGRMSARTSSGLITSLEALEQLAEIFTGIFKGDPVPQDWLRGRVTLIPKRGGDGGLLRDYRPDTVINMEMPLTWISVLQRLYNNNRVGTTMCGVRSGEVSVTRGLKQGFPLSPLLYMLHVSRVERQLEKLGLGFTLGYVDGGMRGCWADYAATHEHHLRKASRRAGSVLRRQGLWGFNHYVIVRGLWKAVHIPALTFANAIICMSSLTREWLERGQRVVGRLGTGYHGTVANEAIKALAVQALRHARPTPIFRLMDDCGGKRPDVGQGGKQSASPTRNKNVVNGRGHQVDTAAVLGVQDRHRREYFYDNSVGSSLLFEARAGRLRTLAYRHHNDPTIASTICRACGEDDESIQHIVLRCKKLPTLPPGDATLSRTQGFC
ncbi:hypothetical protein HPB49_017178 [Dermacentor silvarum]|uniref:Uncharacterized protein n=1 Tax=Dermacentor silvarum TaxID=543639 RepID=A0ACB8E190_DERSI|nr:hypothetical protein HPB49_017178 [Dermacentor silvarum]